MPGRAATVISGCSARASRGQATVELALLLPVVLTLVLGVVQVGLVVRAQIQVVHAAREAARVVAVTGDPSLAADAAARAGGLDPARLRVTVEGHPVSGSVAAVTVVYVAPTDVAIVGPAVGDVTVTARVAMLIE